MQKEKLSSHELAKRLETKQTLIYRLISGENDNPKLDTIKPIAHYFNISISQLIGEKDLIDPIEEEIATENIYTSVPILNQSDIKKDVAWLNNIPLRIIIDGKISSKSFALKINNSSMNPAIPKGAIVVVDPDLRPENKDFVLIQDEDNFFIQYYITKENDKFLLPQLSSFDSIEFLSSPNRIIGTVIRVIYGRKTAREGKNLNN